MPHAIITKKIIDEQAGKLQAEVIKLEIKKAMFSIGDNKAPVGDNKNWEIVGKDVIETVRYCLKENFMDNGVNSKVITLIPKVKNINEMKDYRPRACFNVLYKCYSNVLSQN